MSLFIPAGTNYRLPRLEFRYGFAASAARYVDATLQPDAGKLLRVCSLAAGIGTGAAMTVVSLAVLQMVAG